MATMSARKNFWVTRTQYMQKNVMNNNNGTHFMPGAITRCLPQKCMRHKYQLKWTRRRQTKKGVHPVRCANKLIHRGCGSMWSKNINMSAVGRLRCGAAHLVLVAEAAGKFQVACQRWRAYYLPKKALKPRAPSILSCFIRTRSSKEEKVINFRCRRTHLPHW